MTGKFDEIRMHLMDCCRVLFEGLQYDVLRTGSQEICLPIVGEDNEEGYLVVTFKIPKGSRDGEPYDGYAVAEDYKMKVEQKKADAKKRAEAKAKKLSEIKRFVQRKRGSKISLFSKKFLLDVKRLIKKVDLFPII